MGLQQGHLEASLSLARLLLFEAQSRGFQVRAQSGGAGRATRKERGGGEGRGWRRERVRVSGVQLKDGMPDTW
eukprot:1278420-Rhodomonas_salina.1